MHMLLLVYPSIVRAPWTVVPESRCLCCTTDVLFFIFISPRELRPPSADRRETVPHDRNLGALYNASPEIWGPRRKRLGPKTCKIWGDFMQLRRVAKNI